MDIQIPLEPADMQIQQLLLCYAEEVLCNSKVTGRGVRQSEPDRHGRCVLCIVY